MMSLAVFHLADWVLSSCPCDFNVVTPVLLWQLKVCAVRKPIVLYYLTEFKCIFKHMGYAFLLLSNHKLISFNVISCPKDVCVFILQPLINSIVILLCNLDIGNCSRRKHGTRELHKALPFLHCCVKAELQCSPHDRWHEQKCHIATNETLVQTRVLYNVGVHVCWYIGGTGTGGIVVWICCYFV